MIKIILSVLAICVLMAACNRPECKNTNPIFENNKPDAIAYRQSLHEELSTAKDVRYWANEYIEQDGKAYMFANVQNNNICATAIFDITNTRGLENYREAKGKSYSGSEITDLRYDVVSDSNGYHYILQSIGRIID